MNWSLSMDLHHDLPAYEAGALLLSYRGMRARQECLLHLKMAATLGVTSSVQFGFAFRMPLRGKALAPRSFAATGRQTPVIPRDIEDGFHHSDFIIHLLELVPAPGVKPGTSAVRSGACKVRYTLRAESGINRGASQSAGNRRSCRASRRLFDDVTPAGSQLSRAHAASRRWAHRHPSRCAQSQGRSANDRS